jgi:hypothetical protein
MEKQHARQFQSQPKGCHVAASAHAVAECETDDQMILARAGADTAGKKSPGCDVPGLGRARYSKGPPEVRLLIARKRRVPYPSCSGGLLPPSPPAEQATARQDQAGQSGTGDGAGNRLGSHQWNLESSGFK